MMILPQMRERGALLTALPYLVENHVKTDLSRLYIQLHFAFKNKISHSFPNKKYRNFVI